MFNYKKTVLCLIFITIIFVRTISAQVISLGLLGEPSGAEAEEAYNWAKENYQADQISPDSELKKFAVLWLHEGTNTTLPQIFLEKNVKDNIEEYVSSGGGLLLTGIAFHYIFDLGIESTEPRIYGSGSNEHVMDLIPAEGMDGHPILKGYEFPFTWHVIDFCASSDFYDTPGPEEGKVVLESVTYPNDHPVCEYNYDDGTIIIMGWIIPTWADESVKDNRPVLEEFTEKTIQYLADRSKYMNVDSNNKLAIMWGEVKRNG